jgi:alpha-glucosidase (family GH31 glycosyl hydrolase)
MEDYKDFTIDQTNFGDLPAFVEEIHENNLQFIPIIDAGIAQRKD